MADGGIITQIPDHIRAQFSDQWGMQIQQLDAKLAGVMTVESGWTAKDYYFDDVEKIEWREDVGRHADTNPTEAELSKIRGTKRYLNVAKIFGRRDAEWLGRIGRPDSEVMSAMKAGFNRSMDDRCIAATSEQKYAGPENVQSLISFPAGNVVAKDFVLSGSPADSGLTLAKLFEIERLARTNDVDFDSEEFYLVIGPKQIRDMIALITNTSTTDQSHRMLSAWLENRSSKLLGLFNVIVSNRLEAVTGSPSNRRCVAYTRRAFAKSPESHTTAVDTLPNKSHSVQIAAYGDTGVVRRYDNLCYHMIAVET